jgi:type I restriction enzyme, S subunit
VSELPEGWVSAPLMDTIDLHDNRRIPLNASQRETMKGGFPYFGANGLVDHVNDYLFDGHYVLLAEDGGNFDKPERGVAYEVPGRFWVNNHAHILSPRDKITPRFLRYWLNAIDWIPYVGGTTRAKLTQSGMDRITIPVPPIAEQRRIVAKLDQLMARTARVRAELRSLSPSARRPSSPPHSLAS